MKIKMVQFFIGNNQKYLELSKVCEQINKKYCQIYGYDYQCQYKTWQDTKKEGFAFDDSNGGGVIGVYKMFFLHKLLEKKQDYDFYVFLDSDAAVSKPTIKIEDLIDDTHQFFVAYGNDRFGAMWTIQTMVNAINQKLQSINVQTMSIQEFLQFPDNIQNLFYHIGDNICFNEGFLIIKNTETMKDFFNDCLWYAKYRLNAIRPIAGGIDGRSMSHMLLNKKYNSVYIHMYDQAQGCSASSYEFAYDVDKTFVLHNFGDALTADQKIDWIKLLKQNKWWKPIFEKENR